MTRNERQLKAVEQEMERHGSEADAILQKADDEDRDTSPKEKEEVEAHLKAIKTLRETKTDLEDAIRVEGEVRQIGKKIGAEEPAKANGHLNDVRVINELPSLGKQFVESAGYKSLLEGGSLPGGQWNTGEINLQTKGTLVTSPGTALTPVEYRPGVVETLFERLTVADLLAQGATTSNTIRYVVEGTATSGAAAVDEAGTKPESTLGFEEVTESVRKLATILPVSDEMLEDAPQIESYINQRLSLFIKIEEEAQLLAGNGTAPNVSGILDRSINTWGRGTVDDNAVAIFKAANGVRGSSFLEPDAVVMNPANWQATRLSTDLNGQFYGGGPFYGPYGGPQGPAASSYPGNDGLWGLRVVVTSGIGAGTALVGSFRQAAQLFRRSGLTVEASNSHSTFFAENLTAIRAEERLALAVYRPSAFVAVTGLS